MAKVIKTQADYFEALDALEALVEQNPAPGSSEDQQLELLTVLIDEYDRKQYELSDISAIEAIEFRMEQQGLTPRDLIPFIGSRSKVSEVLSGKRTLTLSMIRNLHEGLGIPLKALVQQDERPLLDEDAVWNLFPAREMLSRGWIVNAGNLAYSVRDFFLKTDPDLSATALYKRSEHIRATSTLDKYALIAWTTRVTQVAEGHFRPAAPFSGVNLDLMRELARVSRSPEGPRLARDFLAHYGVALVIEPHLPRTQLDGVAIIRTGTFPIIGLTLRYDRLDNFWFCLMHELAHIAVHREHDTNYYYDDLDLDPQGDQIERQADLVAREALIADEVWTASAARRLRTIEAAENLAKKVGIHRAIVVGRLQHEYKNFRILHQYVGRGEVRNLFPEVNWSGKDEL